MKPSREPRLLAAVLLGIGAISANPASAVRVNSDGHGQALIYPYYTARSLESGNAYVTALSVTNIRDKPKAIKVRILEGKAGAEVFSLNLYLDAHDTWTAGILAAGQGAGLFTKDLTCSSPKISADPASPTRFSNTAYVGDLLGDSLDRTYEGYFEMLEMGVIDPQSQFGAAVTHVADRSAPNASKPSCVGLPATDTVPAGLAKPSGGLLGGLSYLNVTEGTDFSVDATALSEWSDKVQWSPAGNAHPNLADASPAVSLVIDARDDRDVAYITRWSKGRDAVSALFMADLVVNDYTTEPGLKAATDWVLAMPTKRFYINATGIDQPFRDNIRAPNIVCESLVHGCGSSRDYVHDRESQFILEADLGVCTPALWLVCGTVAILTWARYSRTGDIDNLQHLFPSPQSSVLATEFPFENGWGKLFLFGDLVNRLDSAAGSTTIIDFRDGTVREGVKVTYFGRPVIGFAGLSFTNGLLPVGSGVLSNYGGQFNHKVVRRIEVAP
jgi:hypothetical protein